MDIEMDPSPNENRRALPALTPSCFVAPKATGVVSLILQFLLLIFSVLVTIFFFYHVGGYEYMGWNENSTMLEPIYHNKHAVHTTTTTFPAPTEFNQFAELLNDTSSFSDEFMASDAMALYKNDTEDSLMEIEQIPNTTIYINFVSAQLDMLELIRISTLVYLGMGILWFLSLIGLLLSIKNEWLDFVVFNICVLLVSILYVFVHAMFIAVLLYYQRDISWRTMAIVIGSVVILISTTTLGLVAVGLTVGWYKYIVYMNDAEKCQCLRGLVCIVKGRKRRTPQQAAQEYAMPEVTRHNDIPYADEPAVHNFSQF